MANTFTIKRRDTWPPIEALLQQGDGTPADLRNTSVRLLLRDMNNTITHIIPATVINTITGEVRATLTVAHTLVVQQFRAEFEVTYANGTISTFPSDSYFIVNVLEDLG